MCGNDKRQTLATLLLACVESSRHSPFHMNKKSKAHYELHQQKMSSYSNLCSPVDVNIHSHDTEASSIVKL